MSDLIDCAMGASPLPTGGLPAPSLSLHDSEPHGQIYVPEDEREPVYFQDSEGNRVDVSIHGSAGAVELCVTRGGSIYFLQISGLTALDQLGAAIQAAVERLGERRPS